MCSMCVLGILIERNRFMRKNNSCALSHQHRFSACSDASMWQHREVVLLQRKTWNNFESSNSYAIDDDCNTQFSFFYCLRRVYTRVHAIRFNGPSEKKSKWNSNLTRMAISLVMRMHLITLLALTASYSFTLRICMSRSHPDIPWT